LAVGAAPAAAVQTWFRTSEPSAGLQALSAAELSALWITPKDIPDLARKLAVV
jgi:hypothetical protein